jgi:hypothetical protein
VYPALQVELAPFLAPEVEAVVRESCVVSWASPVEDLTACTQIALDMADYNTSQEFQYANGLAVATDT